MARDSAVGGSPDYCVLPESRFLAKGYLVEVVCRIVF